MLQTNKTTKWSSQQRLRRRSRWFSGNNSAISEDSQIQGQTCSAYLKNINRNKNTNCWRKRGCTSKHLQTIAARTLCWRDKISQCWKRNSKKRNTLRLSPFVDLQGLVRAQLRIGRSQFKFDTKHQVLLHWKHNVVEIFLRNENKNTHHEGTEYVRYIVQQKFWILGIRTSLRSSKNKYMRCRKGRAQTKAALMANLPEERFIASSVFSHVAVDCFGPFTVKIGRRN